MFIHKYIDLMVLVVAKLYMFYVQIMCKDNGVPCTHNYFLTLLLLKMHNSQHTITKCQLMSSLVPEYQNPSIIITGNFLMLLFFVTNFIKT